MSTLFEGGKKLEEAYFKAENDKAVARLRELARLKEDAKALSDVSGITDEAVLARLVALKVRPEALATLAAIPLVEVAWADGHVDEKERSAVLRAARSVEFGKDRVDFPLLESWLEKRPSPQLLEAWTHYIQGLAAAMEARELDRLKHDLLDRARRIAEIAGGFLGMGKVSSSEQAVLDRMDRAFSKTSG
jgi:hypothetical protein